MGHSAYDHYRRHLSAGLSGDTITVALPGGKEFLKRRLVVRACVCESCVRWCPCSRGGVIFKIIPSKLASGAFMASASLTKTQTRAPYSATRCRARATIFGSRSKPVRSALRLADHPPRLMAATSGPKSPAHAGWSHGATGRPQSAIWLSVNALLGVPGKPACPP